MTFILSYQNVFDYLISHNICTPAERSSSEVELKPAKNFNLLVTLSDGRKLLVKQERRDQTGNTSGEFHDEWRVHNFWRTFPEVSHLRSYSSEAIHFDAENSIIIFNYLQDYQDLAEFYAQEQKFPQEIPRSIGSALGIIHRLTMESQDYQQFFQTVDPIDQPQIPNLTRGLDRITPEVFGAIPSDGLKFFALYQRYDTLGKALSNLSASFQPCCLTHNDLKLNNILLSVNWETAFFPGSLSGGIIRLIDWERGSWGDPAFDMGTIIASYLQIWLSSMVTSKATPIEESLRLAAIPLHLLQPSMAGLIMAYLADFPEILAYRPNFLELVVQFSGFALIRSIQAALQYQKTFGNSGICMLQVAKSLLCRPQASINTVFGMEAVDLIPTSFAFH